jgi:diguanylate cyclase (GGDEF)-like protein
VFGRPVRPRPPVLLMLVFGVLLVLVGITATAQAVMVSAYATSSTLRSVVDADVATVRGFVHQGLEGVSATDVAAPDPATTERIDGYLGTLLAKGGIVHAEIRTPDGRVIASTEPGSVGRTSGGDPAFHAAVDGSPSVDIVGVEAADAGGAALPPSVLREFLPLQQDGRTLLVIGLWRDAGPIFALLDGLRRDVVIVTLSAALVAAVVLYLVFRSANRTIRRQTAALVDATRLDPLTETLNHGALVDYLAVELEAARAAGLPLGVALIDVDNFRLLNDLHGHTAGDDVLLTVADAIRRDLPAHAVMGRYGPDEFLVVAGSAAVVELETIVGRTRDALATESLQFDATDRLPLTASAGIATFPDHGASVTELLASVAATLQEARASGGDVVRIAGSEGVERPVGASKFDVLQGLVIAVDTKDRYTKRHSEDVARYGVFLARRLGLDAAQLQVIHTAGLLHDVGKIGVPDAVLRKPGKLTADEYEVVKQHVALGDLIVRDLPDIDEIRAGVRHHHERWDGTGYLHALRGEDIPLVARILAVGDAFSAMTTTRPYRKALDVREALTRLGDAAGTQLDETLVGVFIRGIETADDAPLPGVVVPGIWAPSRQVA